MGIRQYVTKSFTLAQSLAWIWTVVVIALLGAHFYRSGEYGVVLCIIGILGLHCSAALWARWTVGLFLIWGMLEWCLSAWGMTQFRMSMGMPWMRMAFILFSVAALTGLTGGMNIRQAVRAAREHDAPDPFLRAAVFMAVFLILYHVQRSVPFELILLERFFPGLGMAEVFLAACYGAFVAGILADRRRTRKVRVYLWLVFGCAFFVQFALGIFGITQMLLTGRLHVPIPAFILYGSVYRESLNVMPFIVFISTLLAGNAWCSMLCYFGPFDALASRGRAVRPLPRVLQYALRRGRVIILAVGIGAACALKYIGMSTGSAVMFACVYALFSLLIMAVLSRRYGGMMHCTTVCPLGLVTSWLGRLSPWRIRVDKTSCDDCGACEKVCRWRAINAESRARGGVLLRCSLCRDCIGVCHKSAISLRCSRLSPVISEQLFIGIVAVLHAVFLATAMV